MRLMGRYSQVDAICRRPHDELVQHARRLQDHLQVSPTRPPS